MFIAFEGPDNTGKSTSAANLSYDGKAIYNATKKGHDSLRLDTLDESDLVMVYDRIDWFSHMVYRLALPDYEWNDERPRTVFAMPDTHLVVKLHRPDLAVLISDELYTSETLAEVNPVYYYFADFFMGLNEERDYALFKTVSLVEVSNDPRDKSFSQRLVAFSSPAIANIDALNRGVVNDDTLLELLRDDDRQRI